MRRVLIFPFLMGSALMSLPFAGCGVSSPPQEVPPPEEEIPPTARWCAAVAAPFCKARYACCLDETQRSRYLDSGVTLDECKARWSVSECLGPFLTADLKLSLDAGTTVFDQGMLDACVAQFKPLAAGGEACVVSAGSILVNPCKTAFRGQIAPGDPCSWSAHVRDSFMQCKDGYCEDGTCVPFRKLGDACRISHNTNEPPANEMCNYPAGESCRGEGDAGTCQPDGEAGDACVRYPKTFQCKSRYCDVTTNTCQPAIVQSAACDVF
jgi:hypothetical protein